MYFIIISEIIQGKSTKNALCIRDFFGIDSWIPRYAIVEIIKLKEYRKIIVTSTYVEELKQNSNKLLDYCRFDSLYILKKLLNKSIEELQKIQEQERVNIPPTDLS